ncbi:hypothetical protein MRX96_006716 [Rhipicephalus microplus]
MTSSLELVTPLSPQLVLPPTRSEPVSLIPLVPKLPTPEAEPARKGPSSLASACEARYAASARGPGGPEQQVSLRVDEKEVEHVLQDKALLATCLNDSAVL